MSAPPGFTGEEEKPRPEWEVPELGQGLPKVAHGLFSWGMLFLCRLFCESHFFYTRTCLNFWGALWDPSLT